ncbi:MAG: fibronectin type III domain-containing protein [Candidatus Zixiibacteriota bacterium]
MKKIIFILLLALLTGGCDRYIDSEDLDFTLPEAPPVPIYVKAIHLSESIMLEWQVPDTLAGMSFNVYYTDSIGKPEKLWVKTIAYSATITGLISGHQYYFMVSSVNSDGLEGEKSEPITTSPGLMSVVIAGGDIYTNSRNVRLDFIVPVTATVLQVSEDALFNDAVWESYAAAKSFELSAGDGVKHVYARFRFADGSETDISGAVTDSIILDTETSISAVYFTPDDQVLVAGDSVEFFVVSSEGDGTATITFTGQSSIALTFNEAQSNIGANRYVYSRIFGIPTGLEAVGIEVVGHFTDAAGNTAATVNAPALLTISNPPSPVTMYAVAESSSSIRLSWSQSVDDDFSAYQIYRGLSAAVSNNSDPVAVITGRTTRSYKDENLDESTQYFYRIYVYDNTGLFAASTVVSAVTLANQAPAPVTLSAGIDGGAVSLSWTQNHDADFESYRVYRATSIPTSIDQEIPLVIISDRATTTFDNSPGAGTYYYGVAVFDEQGEWAISNWLTVSVP